MQTSLSWFHGNARHLQVSVAILRVGGEKTAWHTIAVPHISEKPLGRLPLVQQRYLLLALKSSNISVDIAQEEDEGENVHVLTA